MYEFRPSVDETSKAKTMSAPLRILSDEQLRMIHNASLTVLGETGMMVDHAKAREVLEAAGASVSHDSKVVKFPRPLVEEKLALVPSSRRRARRDWRS